MVTAVSYPGVYIEELSSGLHAITGVATSIAAFIGWAPQGPITKAVMVESFTEYQAIFGTFVSGVFLAYAVEQFFQNGGQQAYVVRITTSAADTPGAGIPATASAAWPTGAGVTLYANNPGQWANTLVVTLTPQPANPARFSLLVQLPNANGVLQTLESYNNLSCSATDPQYIVPIINGDSNYITFTAPGTTTAQTVTGTPPAGVTLVNPTGGLDGDVLIPGNTAPPLNFELAVMGVNGQLGVNLLSPVPIFNLLCVPGETDATTISGLQQFCQLNRAFLIVDSPSFATAANFTALNAPYGTSTTSPFTAALPASPPEATNSAYYYPWVLAPDPLFGGRPTLFPPCGFVAGIYAATDASRGVWKAPAGIATTLTQVLGLQTVLTDRQNGDLNPLGVNCLRQFRNTGNVVWGSRTVAGADAMGSQWKYIPIRRLALFIESSLYDGTQWVVFEPNDEALWGQIRLNVGTFMQGLFLQGAFAGTMPQRAYFVKCDAENNPQSTTALGIVNILVGFAPLYPAEFVVIQIQQMINQS